MLAVFYAIGEIMLENIDYSLEWLTEEIIKEYDKQKKTNEQVIITIPKIELLKLVIKFVKLNQQYE